MKTIWMVCTPICGSPGIQDGAYVAVAFDRKYLKLILAKIALAKRVQAKHSGLYRIVFSSGLYWLKKLTDAVDGELAALANEIADDNGSSWFEMPANWDPTDEQQCRTELTTLEVGDNDILFQFREKHSDFEFETPTLSAAELKAMLSRLG
jgi:hypothetical protein